MPDPFSIGGALVGGGLQLFSGLAAAASARRAASFQAALDERNAQMADYAASDAVQRGRYGETLRRLRGGQVEGEQKAAYANAGVDVQSGSALDVLGSTAAVTELDAQVIRNNAAREAWGYSTQAAQLRFRAKMARATGEQQSDAAILGGVVGAAQYGIPLLRIGGSPSPSPSPPAVPYGGPSHTDFNDQGI